MNKYTHIEEFEPVELIIAYQISDVPSEYIDLLKTWFNTEDPLEDIWDYGSEIKMMHWEWKQGPNYYLIVDITGHPNEQEQGIIAINGKIIYENNNKKLHALVKAKKGLETPENIFLSRHKSFEYIRKLPKDQHQHIINVQNLYEELKSDLVEESVSEDEFRALLTQPYIHYSSDDASDVSDYETY